MNQQTKRVAIYLRVSTKEQSTEVQFNELTAYSKARGWFDCVVYEDKASGTNTNRAQLSKLLHDVSLGKFDIVLV